jgi:hypothetical protein
VDHRFVASFVYNLPFGQGEKFASDATGVKNAVLGGWQVNGIATFQNGFPLTITAGDPGGFLDTFGQNRADVVGDPLPSGFDQNTLHWFDPAAFKQPAAGKFGSVGRNTLRGPGIKNVDLALFKNFRLPAGTSFQLRFESFNAFNTAQFDQTDVVTNVNDPRFGLIVSSRPARINQIGLKFLF